MKRLLLSSIFLLVVLYATIIYSASGTPSTLIVKTDANNYLLATAVTQTNPVTQGVFSSRTLRTDSTGSLQVVLTGTVTPTYPLSIPASTCAAPSLGLSGGATTGIAFTATPSILECISGTAVGTITSSTYTLTIPFRQANGSASAPSYSFTNATNWGMYWDNANSRLTFATNGVNPFAFGNNADFIMGNDSANIKMGGTSDLHIVRETAATLQLGQDAAGVTNQMFKGPDRITSDGVGGDLTIAGGRNRGASAGGSIIFQTSPAVGAGVTGTLTTQLLINSTGFLQFGGTTSSFPSLVRSSATLLVRLADNSGYATIAAGNLNLANTFQILSTATDGFAYLTDSTGANFARLGFGGTTSSFPSIKRNGTGLDIRLADDSGFALLSSGRFTATQSSIGNTVQSLISNATNDDPEEVVFQGRTTTTDATPTTINTITIATSFETLIECRVIARRTGGASGAAEDGGGYYVWVAVKNTAGTVAELAAETTTTVGESTAGFNVTAAPSGATELIQVTGAATTNLTWHSTCRTYAVNQ